MQKSQSPPSHTQPNPRKSRISSSLLIKVMKTDPNIPQQLRAQFVNKIRPYLWGSVAQTLFLFGYWGYVLKCRSKPWYQATASPRNILRVVTLVLLIDYARIKMYASYRDKFVQANKVMLIPLLDQARRQYQLKATRIIRQNVQSNVNQNNQNYYQYSPYMTANTNQNANIPNKDYSYNNYNYMSPSNINQN